jgi:hypothetical protein
MKKDVNKTQQQKMQIDVRVKQLVDYVTSSESDWKLLEKRTLVPAEKWRHFARGTTKASAEMIEGLCAAWPSHAFWLATGIQDWEYGHVAPNSEGFPMPYENQFRNKRNHEYSAAYFKELLKSKRIDERVLDAVMTSGANEKAIDETKKRQAAVSLGYTEYEQTARNLNLLLEQYSDESIKGKMALYELICTKAKEFEVLPEPVFTVKKHRVFDEAMRLINQHLKLIEDVENFKKNVAKS